MPGRKPRVLLADDHEDVAGQIATLLSDDFEIVGIAKDGLELLETAAAVMPDIVVTDYKMPGVDGIEAARKLLKNHLCKAVVLLTLHEDQHLLSEAREAGVTACVLKRNAGEDLPAAVHTALKTGTFVQREWLRPGSPSGSGGISCCSEHG